MEKLLEDNPLVTAAIQLWFTKRMEEAVLDSKMSEDLKNSFKSTVVSEEKLAPILGTTPRSLFEFFDDNQVYILPVEKDGRFSATVNGELLAMRGYLAKRVDAEVKAIKVAFPILEEILADGQ